MSAFARVLMSGLALLIGMCSCAYEWLVGAQLREKDMPTPTAAHKNLIMASLVHLSFPSACHGLFLVVFVLFIVAANEYPDSSCSGM